MKVGGRIIQNKNISVSTENEFIATYKKHHIKVAVYEIKKGENPKWSCEVRNPKGICCVETVVQRCKIHDAIFFCLNGALL